MNRRTIIGRLLWKDIVTIKSLVIAAAVGIVAINLLIFFIWRYQQNPGFAVAQGFILQSSLWWILIPNLVALGAPAMLVGNEEESGTLDWLRTLPIGWHWIAVSKFCVALVAIAATWLLASAVFWLQSLSWREHLNRPGADFQFTVDHMFILGFFAVSLLLIGFLFVYLIRAPLLAVLATVPAFFVYFIVVVNLDEFYVDTGAGSGIGVDSVQLGIAILTVLGLCQLWLARRRLLLPVSTISSRFKSDILSNYRAPMMRPASRPTPIGSLLWQQLRQTGPLCLTLILVSVFLSILFCVSNGGTTPNVGGVVTRLSPLFILLSASWFGAVVFYSDNVHARRAFFADRGISPTRVWWTRMAPPAAGFLVTWLFVGLISLSLGGNAWIRVTSGTGFFNVTVLAFVMFAFGQLVSQWAQRPLMAFMAAPAYTFISLSPLFYLMEWFRADFAVTVLTVPVLLLASWQLTGRWLEGRVNAGYTARVLGYTAIAVFIPCLWIIGSELRSQSQLYRYMVSHQAADQTIVADRATDTQPDNPSHLP